MKFLIGMLSILLDWAITVAFVALIAFCFSLNTNLLVATGIWLLIVLIKTSFCGD